MLLTDFVEYHAKARPNSPLLIQDDQCISFSQAIVRARGIAGWLQEQGVRIGGKVAFLGQNSADHVILLLAASYVGAVFVPLNYRLAATELVAVIEDAQAKLLICCDPLPGGTKDALKEQLNSGCKLFDSLGKGEPFTDACVSEESEILLQLYTSGTTGLPKGVQISHKNVNALVSSSWMSYLLKPGYGTKDLVVAPLFHIGGLASVMIPMMAGGAVVLHRQFEPEKIVSDIEEFNITTIFLVPAMIQAIINSVPNIRQRDFANLKQIVYGASPITPHLLKDAIDLFGCDFYQFYGMTETTGSVVALLPQDHRRALDNQHDILNSCGRSMAGVAVKICDSNGEEVAPGETGEILIRSNGNMCGYWQRPEDTQKTVREGWVYSGDAGVMDEEGYIYIRDRIKDMVVTGGENVYPVEVENVLTGHPSIVEAAVIGVPDETYGEALMAVCALSPESQLSVQDLVDFCRGKIAGYKIPRKLKIVDAVPRNPSGKILKKLLREPYWKAQERGV